MKAVIFAGGVGTRLWPLSRKKSPKQFEKFIENKSTLQRTTEHLLPEIKKEDIYIASGEQYKNIIQEQLPWLDEKNIILEPAKRDNGPAVALAMTHLFKSFPDEPVIILWSDHLVKDSAQFKQVIKTAGKVVEKDPYKIIIIGQKPRFASENLGWIHYGDIVRNVDGINLYTLQNFKYKPNKEVAEEYFKDGHYGWNLGYFVSTPKCVMHLFKKYAPEVAVHTEPILNAIDTPSYSKVLKKEYSEMPNINLDNAIIEKMDFSLSYVMIEDLQWSDMGAWESLKDALQKHPQENVTHGDTMLEECTDNLVFNYDDHKMIVGIDLSEMLIINTKDVLLVTKKSSVPKIKKLVEKLEANGEYSELL